MKRRSSPLIDKDQLRREYGDLVDRVSFVLFEEDPIGINSETNTDEYDPEAATILPRLRHMASAAQARSMIHGEFVRWFDGPEIAGPEARYSAAAARIWDIWCTSPLFKRE